MDKRVSNVKKIDKILGILLTCNRELLELAEEIEDKELKTELLKCVIIFSAQGTELNEFLMKNLGKYLNKDLDDIEFLKLMQQLEGNNGYK